MKSLDLTKPITTESLLKEFESRFNMTMDLSPFNEEELQDYANHVRTKIHEITQNTHFGQELTNDGYQKNQMMLDIINQAIQHSDIAVAMGGRIAEEIIFGHDKVTSGASSDIDMVTKMAKNMVTKYGMSKELGTIAYGENEEEVFLGRSVTKQQNMSEETAKKVDLEVKKIVDKGYERAREVLTEKIDDLHKLAKALLVYETLSGDEIRDLILKNIKPSRSFKDEDEDSGKASSALGSLGLKPKPAI